MAKKRDYIQLQLTCANQSEAANIAGALLGARLVACVKRLPVESANWWQGEIEQGSEVLLIMDSAEDLFDAVEDQVAQLHSYETFVLQSLPVLDVSRSAQAWLEDALAPAQKRRKR